LFNLKYYALLKIKLITQLLGIDIIKKLLLHNSNNKNNNHIKGFSSD